MGGAAEEADGEDIGPSRVVRGTALASVRRRTWGLAARAVPLLALSGAAAVCAARLDAGLGKQVWVLALVPACLGGLFTWAALTAHRAMAAVRRGRCRAVRFEGWSRAPDGTWVACYDPTTGNTTPLALMKLPLVQDTGSGRGWLFSLRRDDSTSAALTDRAGALVATGRIMPWSRGEKAWIRQFGPPRSTTGRPSSG